LEAEAEAFAQRGVLTLIYDKRTIGYSLVERDFSLLADDALAGLDLLMSRSDVDPDRVGIWGLSEGAWVASLAASRSDAVDFVVVAGAAGMTPSRQTAWAYGQRLEHAGASGSLYRTLQVRGMHLMKGLDLFANADYDAVSVWEEVDQPVLALWGEFDREVAPEESSTLIVGALERGDNRHYTMRFVPDVRHNLNDTFDHGFDRPDSIPATYGDIEAAWIHDLEMGLPETRVDLAPAQDRSTTALPAPAWYDLASVQVGVWALMLVGFGSYPLTAIVRRLRHRRDVPFASWTMRAAVAAGLAAVLGGTVYLLFLLITAANIIGPVVFGQPVPWLVLRVLAIATVASAVLTAWRWWRVRSDIPTSHRVRMGLVLGTTALFVPWAFYWGLLT
jgi:dienelactone hydrolase